MKRRGRIVIPIKALERALDLDPALRITAVRPEYITQTLQIVMEGAPLQEIRDGEAAITYDLAALQVVKL